MKRASVDSTALRGRSARKQASASTSGVQIPPSLTLLRSTIEGIRGVVVATGFTYLQSADKR